MKISIFLIHTVATIVLLTFLPCHQTDALKLGEIQGKTTDLANLGWNAGKGIAQKVPDLIPSPAKIMTLSKNALLGLPFEVLLSVLDQLCSLALAAANSTEPFKQPKIEEMNYVLLTESDNFSVPITEPTKLWKHDKFDPTKKVVILVTGWNSDIADENSAASALWGAYKARGGYNFILVDTARYVDTLYAWSAFNTMDLGTHLGKGLAQLVDIVPLENIHLMGHSLGAHIVGQAGKTFQADTDKMLPRITGFDPAKPCFNEGESLQGLGRGDAEFVDVIHSDAGGLGKSEAIGDADFFPNGIVSLMPGCYTIFCSHSRAWEYFAETVMPGNENNYIAKKCGSLFSYEINACIRKEVPMGFACPSGVKGNFFLKTHGKSPFGKGKKEA